MAVSMIVRVARVVMRCRSTGQTWPNFLGWSIQKVHIEYLGPFLWFWILGFFSSSFSWKIHHPWPLSSRNITGFFTPFLFNATSAMFLISTLRIRDHKKVMAWSNEGWRRDHRQQTNEPPNRQNIKTRQLKCSKYEPSIHVSNHESHHCQCESMTTKFYQLLYLEAISAGIPLWWL